jgi:hypothetical protein
MARSGLNSDQNISPDTRSFIMGTGFCGAKGISRFLKPVSGIFAIMLIIFCVGNGENKTYDSILDLYEEYDMVHMGERHWNMTDYNFRMALLNYPRFTEVVDDIVIESSNYLYQDVLDRYILELDEVPKSELQKVWRNSVVVSGVWDATIYKDFIYEVRKVNEDLSREKRIRLLAAEPPIDWSKVNTESEWFSFLGQRSTHTPKVVKSEVIDKGRKAFIIYGGAHFYKDDDPFGGCSGNLRKNLEKLTGKPVFSILPLSGDDPFVKNFQDTTGAVGLPLFINLNTSRLSKLPGNIFFPEARGRLRDFTDGILFFGTGPDEEAEYDPEAAKDSVYQAERERRRAIESQW